MNRWNVMALYAAIVCLISITMTLINLTTLSQHALKLAMPWYLEASVPDAFNLKDNESYRRTRCPRPNDACDLANMPEDKITAMREKERNESHAQQLAFQRTLALKSAVDESVSLLIALAFFTIHWRVLKKALRPQPA